jgi:hypothetical protein
MTVQVFTIFTARSTAVTIRTACVNTAHAHRNTQQGAMCSATGSLNGGRTKAIKRHRPNCNYTRTAVGCLPTANSSSACQKHRCKPKVHRQSTKSSQQSLPWATKIQSPTTHTLHVQLLATIPSISSFSKLSLHFSFSNRKCICISQACYMYGPFHFA